MPPPRLAQGACLDMYDSARMCLPTYPQHAHTHSDAHAHQYVHANSHADSVAYTIQMRIRMPNLFCRVNAGDVHQVPGLYDTSTHHLLSGHFPELRLIPKIHNDCNTRPINLQLTDAHHPVAGDRPAPRLAAGV